MQNGAKSRHSKKACVAKGGIKRWHATSMADKPKKAVQYSTGINDAIKRIAKKQDKTVNEYIAELFESNQKP